MSIQVLKQLILVCICQIAITADTFGQSKVIDLWNGKVPGAIINMEYKQIVDSADNWTKMRFVTNPTLDIYLAPKEMATGTAVIICPGGGYWGLAIDHEGVQVAKWLNSLGITAFVLKYRLPSDALMVDKFVGPM